MPVYSKVRKDGTKAWFYDFMHNKVRYRGVGGTTKTQASRTLDKIRTKVLNGDFDIQNRPGNPKFEQFAELFITRKNHLRSIKRYEASIKNLKKKFIGKTLLAITSSEIEDYISFRKDEGAQNATINRELMCLKRMYNLAIKWKEAKENPVNDIDLLEEPPGRTRFLLVDEVNLLLESCSKHVRPIVFTAVHTGLRLSEILSLTWDRVHIASVIDPYLEITDTKNNKTRFIPLNEDMIELIKSLENNASDFVFLSTKGERLYSVRKPFEIALKIAGILNFRFHDLRHTFASHFVMNGGDLLTLKEILGHSSMQMVERYAHLAAAHKRRQINNLHGLFSNCHPIATWDNKEKSSNL